MTASMCCLKSTRPRAALVAAVLPSADRRHLVSGAAASPGQWCHAAITFGPLSPVAPNVEVVSELRERSENENSARSYVSI
jgi:hypothetical protein